MRYDFVSSVLKAWNSSKKFGVSPRDTNCIRLLFCGLIAVFFCCAAVGAQQRAWQKRIGRDVAVRHKLSYQTVGPAVWPDEPTAPETVDAAQFQQAVGTLCGSMPAGRLEKIAGSVLAEGIRFGVDPFLLAALVAHQSGCRPRTPERETRFGLTRIDIDMHAPHIRSGVYRYFVSESGAWSPKTLDISAHKFNQWSAQKIVPNLYFAAAILRVFSEQCTDLDAAFNGVPHRHFVSHWFFGDVVRHSEPEDAVLSVRRRLLDYYRNAGPTPAGAFREIPLVSPLDGAPRLLLDYFGNKRGDKRGSGHQGIDLAGLTGEPVRAIADGRVVFAGVDLPGSAPSRRLTPAQVETFPRRALGNGGIWVTLNHGSGFRTAYMHLDGLAVQDGDSVRAGDIIGTLGNTGTVASGPHLHLEFRTDKGDREDPAVHLRSVIVDPWQKK